MIGTPVTPATPVGTPVLVMRRGHVVHVGAFESGDGSESVYGRVVVEMRGSTARFESVDGYVWSAIDAPTARKITNSLTAIDTAVAEVTRLRVLVDKMANGDTP